MKRGAAQTRSGVRGLLERAAEIDAEGFPPRRRQEVIDRAIASGYERDHAEQLYDVALAEDVDPVLAFDLVLCRVGVSVLSEPVVDQWEETQVEATPPWVAGDATAPQEAARERRIRTSFRRLKSALENAGEPAAALRAFVAEPDIGEIEY